MAILNDYQKVYSLTGKPVTIKTDNTLLGHLGLAEPWKYVHKAALRYRPIGKGAWEIERTDGAGYLPITDPDDQEYWTNYVIDLENKAKSAPKKKFWQKNNISETPAEEKKRGGRLMRVGGKIVEVPRTLK